eukprot:3334860-Rhodomonas_salina.2
MLSSSAMCGTEQGLGYVAMRCVLVTWSTVLYSARYWPRVPTPHLLRTQMEKTHNLYTKPTISTQFVPQMCSLVSDFGVFRATSSHVPPAVTQPHLRTPPIYPPPPPLSVLWSAKPGPT